MFGSIIKHVDIGAFSLAGSFTYMRKHSFSCVVDTPQQLPVYKHTAYCTLCISGIIHYFWCMMAPFLRSIKQVKDPTEILTGWIYFTTLHSHQG